MTWFYLVLGASMLMSITSILEKKILLKEHAMEYSSVLAILNTLFSIPLLFFIDYSNIPIYPLLLMFVVTILSVIGFIMVAKSMRHMDVSIVSPMLNLSTGVTAILAFIFLGESLTYIQTAGIILLIIGSYILQSHKEESIWSPLRNFIDSKYLHFVLIAVLCYGIGSIFDRYILRDNSINPILLLITGHIAISFYILMIMIMFYDGLTGIKNGLKKMHWWIVIASIVTVTQRLMTAFSIQMAYIGLVVAIKHASSFFTILVSGELFHEKNILRKLFASAIMIAGVTMVVLK